MAASWERERGHRLTASRLPTTCPGSHSTATPYLLPSFLPLLTPLTTHPCIMADPLKTPSLHPASIPAQHGPATTPILNGNSNLNADAGPSTPLPRVSANAHGNGSGDPSGFNASGPAPPEVGQDDGDDTDVSQAFAQRREEELARRDRSLAEFLVMLDGYKPLVSGQ